MRHSIRLIKSSTIFFGAALFAFLLLVAALSFTLLIKDEQVRITSTDILYPILNTLSVIALAVAAWQSRLKSKQLFIAWGVLALAQLSFTLGDIIWGVLEVGMKINPYPSLADIGYLVYYPLFLTGMLLMPTIKPTRLENVKNTLDMSIILLVAGLGLWNFLIGPLVISSGQDGLMSQILALAYPLGDLLLIGALLRLLYRQVKDQNQAPIELLMLAAIIMVVTDIIFSYQTLQGTYASGGLLDIGYVCTYLIAGLAGVLQAITVISGPILNVHYQTRLLNFLSRERERIMTYLPYVISILAFLLLGWGFYYPLPINKIALLAGVGAVIALVLVRQFLAFHENGRLNGKLSQALAQVQGQTHELEETNKELRNEISEREHAEERLSYDALHDGLTGLPNRVLFMDRLEMAIEYTKRRTDYPFSVLFLDLDHFKVINDSLGHNYGDQLLILIAGRIQRRLRQSDTLARLGGDEFVFLLENTLDEKDLIYVATCIQNELRSPFQLQNHLVSVTASIGIVPGLFGYNSAADVLRDADLAMYHAKGLGKDRFEFFNARLRTQAISRLELENDLRQAIVNNEFQLHYQPILSLANKEVIGFEALLRWNHPEKGLLMPSDFIYIAEESGLIHPIGEWVLFEACSQIKHWNEIFAYSQPLGINVNISGKQFTQPNFVKGIESVLQKTGIDPSTLRLEITETAIIENTTIASDVFEQLRSLGIQCQIDDFGTGYSSLGYLQHFPIHTIKIDRTFVEDIRAGGKGTDLIRAMILMANELGMETIAEGIETDEQLQQLKELTCKFGQGYLLSRPVDSLRAEEFLERRRTSPSVEKQSIKR